MASSAIALGTEPRCIVIFSNDAEASTAFENELSRVAQLVFALDVDSLHVILESSVRSLLLADLDSLSSDHRETDAFVTTISERYPQVPVIALTRSRTIARHARQSGA